MTIAEWLKNAGSTLADAMIPSARLDAEIILAHTIGHPRTYLHAHGDEILDGRRIDIANARLELRIERVPVAYIIGHKEFYGRRFYVSPEVLIPRPESEAMIELLKKHMPQNAKNLVDIGAGSGCLGITAKLELPQLAVTLIDISADALKIAAKNADFHSADIRTLNSNLLAAYPLVADIILANLPYVDRSWEDNSPELTNEPELALYADDHGLKLIKKLLTEARARISKGALIILEADQRQHAAIVSYATERGYKLLEINGLAIALTNR